MAEWFNEITILALCGLAFAVLLELKNKRKREKILRQWAEEFASEAGGAESGHTA